jgi:hypothetical protein
MGKYRDVDWTKTGTVAGYAEYLRKQSDALCVVVIRPFNSVLAARRSRCYRGWTNARWRSANGAHFAIGMTLVEEWYGNREIEENRRWPVRNRAYLLGRRLCWQP